MSAINLIGSQKDIKKASLKNSQLPISILPYEIFADIFFLSQLASEDGGQSHTLRQEQAISHVSHSWRECALDTARLWTRIEVLRPKHHDVHRVASYLKLSKAMVIDIVIGRCLDGERSLYGPGSPGNS